MNTAVHTEALAREVSRLRAALYRVEMVLGDLSVPLGLRVDRAYDTAIDALRDTPQVIEVTP